MDCEGRTFQVDGKEQGILNLLLAGKCGQGVEDNERGWDQNLKALLKQYKRFDLFSVGSHYRMLSGLMTGSVQKDNLIGSMKDRFRREQSWRKAESR